MLPQNLFEQINCRIQWTRGERGRERGEEKARGEGGEGETSEEKDKE